METAPVIENTVAGAVPLGEREEMEEVPERPALAEGVERRDFGSYGVVAPPGSGSLLHLQPDEFVVLDLMDGTRTTSQIEAAAAVPVADLIGDLQEEGFLRGSPPEPSPKRVVVTLHGVEFGGFDRVVGAVNRAVGDVVFSPRVAVSLAIVAVVGLAAFTAQATAGQRLTVSTASPVLAVIVLRTLGLLSVGPHETAHALVTVRNHRRVGRFGVGFYWGALTFYVDASHALFLPRRTRMLQSSAGVISDMVLCGAASLVAVAGGDATWAVVVREYAVLGYLGVLTNAVPLLELDGYWFMADALDRPTLHRDARQALVEALHRRPGNRRLASYGAASITFGLVGVGAGLAAWWGLFGGLFVRLWHGGVGYRALALYLILPFVPMVAHLSVQLLRFLRGQRTPSVVPVGIGDDG